MITPRSTRLLRAASLDRFRRRLVELACAGSPLDARDRLVVVPTRAAASHLVRTIEDDRLAAGGTIVLPELITPGDLVETFALRLPPASRAERRLSPAAREVLLTVACREVRDAGIEPPFRVRPGLVAEMLRFYDALRRHGNRVDDFERLALERLEPGAEFDRGAERLVRQTRFLAAAFRAFESRAAEAGLDEHHLRARLLGEAAPNPWRHVVLAVTDRAFDRFGLWPADWDLLSRVPGLEQFDLVITDGRLMGALHERLHSRLPGIEEHRDDAIVAAPVLVVPTAEALLHTARDREEEVALFARRVKHEVRAGRLEPERAALVVQQPLPYVYVARDILRSAGLPWQMFDALPLAAEPYAAALDLVFSFASSGFARVAAIALLRSPHFRFSADPGVSLRDIAALDRALAEAGYLGEIDGLERLLATWRQAEPERGLLPRAIRAGELLLDLARQLAPLRDARPAGDQLALLIDFLQRHEHLPGPDDPLRVRQLRARSAILATLASLRDAHAAFDPTPLEVDGLATLVRRWIEDQTFAPRNGESGVHVVDASSAAFGRFTVVQLAGLVDGEWPDRPARNIFYSPSILRDLGWPAEAERLDGARAAFADLLGLPDDRLVLSTFSLEADAVVAPSPLVDEVERAGLTTEVLPVPTTRIFDWEALAYHASWPPEVRPAGMVAAVETLPAYSLSALERYQDCPFKFFAADVLKLEEEPEDESALSPRARGRFIHEVFQRFFEAWDGSGAGTITTDSLDAARERFREVAEPLLAKLPEADAAIERSRLFGSAIAVGIIDVVLGLEAQRPVDVRRRLLEHRFEGRFTLGSDERTVALKGVADRVDLLAGRRLRVIDYKSGSAPNPRRALQVPIYALCAAEERGREDGGTWSVDEAAYVAFSGKKALATVVKSGGSDAAEALGAARTRLFEVLDGIGRGEFPPRPHDEMICRWCAYPSVCRKDYVGDE